MFQYTMLKYIAILEFFMFLMAVTLDQSKMLLLAMNKFIETGNQMQRPIFMFS